MEVTTERLANFARGMQRLKLLEERDRQAGEGGLIHFVRYFWDVIEPNRPLKEGWPLEALCLHLEAITFGELIRWLGNVPPGFMKSLLVNVFWPAWEWSAMDMPHMRYVSFSYSAHLTERDNRRLLDILQSHKFQEMYGDKFRLKKAGETLISNDKTGWKLASSVGGVGTGERGDRILLDDPHNVKQGESEAVRTETVRWFREAMSNRLNDMENGAIVVIMQRVHEEDVSGTIISQDLGYCHLMIPMEYDEARHCETEIGWSDPRIEEGDLAWPERFTPAVIEREKRAYGPYAYASQYQQMPTPRGGGILKREWWQLWGNADDPDDPTYKQFPSCELVIGFLDTAYTEKQENDYSALTVWGLWRNPEGLPKLILMNAWRDRLTLHDLVERSAKTCRRFKLDRLIIEAKASGISVAQELRRLYAGEGWGIQTVDPGRQDKVARAYAVQPVFADAMVYAPDRDWADMVITECASFPKAPHDDLVDTVTGALRWLRDNGFLQRGEEVSRELTEAIVHRSENVRPLYGGV